MSDDFTADTRTTGTVSPNGLSVTGHIETSGDRDWFAVELKAGATYRINLIGRLPNNDSDLDPYLYGVYDSEGNLLPHTTDDDSGSGPYYSEAQVTFSPTKSGTYYVSAGGTNKPQQVDTGQYWLSVRLLDDFEAAYTTTGRVVVGGSVTGNIETNTVTRIDQDWFAVELEAGKTYRFDLEGESTGKGTLRYTKLFGIYDSGGTIIPGTTDNGSGTGLNSLVTFMPTSDGTYHVSAGAVTHRGDGTYTLSVTLDLAANTGTAGTVAVGGSVTSELVAANDQDWFAVTLEAGRTYHFDLEGSPTGAGTLSDPYLRGIYDSDGTIIAGTTDDDGGTGYNSRVTFTPTTSGTYYVSAGAYGSNTGAYKLSVVGGDRTDDFTVDTGTAGRVAVGGSATGYIETSNDRDWFAVELEAGGTYHFDLEGVPTDAGTLADPHLYGIYDSSGTIIADTADDNSGTGQNSRMTFTPTTGGTYYVSAGAVGDGTGSYTLSVTDNDLADDSGTAGRVAVGGSVTSEIEVANDRDWFAVELTAGRTYRFDLEGAPTDAGTLADPYLYGIYDSSGTIIAGTTDDNSGTDHNSQVNFTPTTGGTYYVSAGPVGNGTGTYTLSVLDTDDDFLASTRTSGTVAVGGSATGEIEVANDRDWFAVELAAGSTYRFDLRGAETGDGSLSNPEIHGMYDSGGGEIADTSDEDGGTGHNSRVTFTAETSGTYYVATSGHGSSTGTYTLSATLLDDFTADTGTAGTVTFGGTATGVINSASDLDWFAVDLLAGTTYRFDLEGSTTRKGTLHDPYLRGIYDSGGTIIAGTSDDNGGRSFNSRVTFTPTETGRYYVSAGAHKDSNPGTYTLSVTLPGLDLAADSSTAGTVAVGGSVESGIDSAGDVDWFAVTLEAGETYRLDLAGRPTGDGTLADPYLNGVYNSDGNFIAGTSDDDGGTGHNSRVTFTPTTSGTYYVSAGGAGSDTGTYILSALQLQPGDDFTSDFAADTSTAGTVAVGGSVTAEVGSAADADWFAIQLVAGTTYRFDLEGRPTGAGTLHDPYLNGIYDSGGNFVDGTGDNDSGTHTNSRVTFTPTETGRYYVSAGAVGDGTGTYTLSVTLPGPDLAADASTAGTIAVGGSVQGAIDSAGDVDWFAVTLEAGETYRLDLAGKPTADGTLADPYLNGVYNSDGKIIAGTSDDDGGTGNNSRVTFTPTESGTYYVSAGGAGSHTGTYILSALQLQPGDDFTSDFAADASTTGTVAVGGSVTAEVSSAGDSDWFAIQLVAGTTYRFDLEGSPTGAGTLHDPYLKGIYDSGGTIIAGTSDNDSGTHTNSRVTFTATANGTYYVSAGGNYGFQEGTYTLSVEEVL